MCKSFLHLIYIYQYVYQFIYMSKDVQKHSGGFLDLFFAPSAGHPHTYYLGNIQESITVYRKNFFNFFNDLGKIRLDFVLKL